MIRVRYTTDDEIGQTVEVIDDWPQIVSIPHPDPIYVNEATTVTANGVNFTAGMSVFMAIKR